MLIYLIYEILMAMLKQTQAQTAAGLKFAIALITERTTPHS